MKKHLLPLALLFSGISPAQALDVGDISSFMNSDSSTLSKTIKNSTDSGRLINIRLERLSSPLDDGQVISMDKPDEFLLTPASLLLPAQASEVIRFFYKGPADEKERYYRIVWFDQALSDAQRDNANRQTNDQHRADRRHRARTGRHLGQDRGTEPQYRRYRDRRRSPDARWRHLLIRTDRRHDTSTGP